jgi:ribonucleotide monophosphatase NagD (HAD superfamily)
VGLAGLEAAKLTLKVENHELNKVLVISVLDSGVVSSDMTTRKLHAEGNRDAANVFVLGSSGAMSHIKPGAQ